jgi:hypothetical protein
MSSALDNETLIRAACDAQRDLERVFQSAVTAAHDGTPIPNAIAATIGIYDDARQALAARASVSPDMPIAESIAAVEDSRIAALELFATLEADAVRDFWLAPLQKRAVRLLAAHEAGKAPDPPTEDFLAALIEVQRGGLSDTVRSDLVVRLRDSAGPEYQTAVAFAAIGQLPLPELHLADAPSSEGTGEEANRRPVVSSDRAGDGEPSDDSLSEDDDLSGKEETADAANAVEPLHAISALTLEQRKPGGLQPVSNGVRAKQSAGNTEENRHDSDDAESVVGYVAESHSPTATPPDEQRSDESDPCGEYDISELTGNNSEKLITHDISDRARCALLAMVRAQRFGLASHIARSSELPSGLVQTLEFAAYAAGLCSATGAAAAQVRERAEALAGYAHDGAELDRAAKLIAYGAALRVAAVAPHLGGALVLNECRSSIGEDAPELQQLGSVVQQVSEKGISITHDLVEQRTDAAGLEMQLAQLRKQAEVHIENPGTIKFARATSLWRIMVQSQEHELAKALRAVRDDDVAGRDDALATTMKLRNRKTLGAVIDELDHSKMRPSVNRRIDGVARESLRVRILEVVELVERWIDVNQRIERLRLSQESAWLRQASEELASAAVDLREADTSGWPGGEDEMVCVAATVLRRTTDEVVEMVLDGKFEPDIEGAPELLLGAELLCDPEIRFDPVHEPAGAVPLANLLELTSEPDWREAFERRAERQDHDLLPLIIELLRQEDPASAASYEARCDHLLNQARRGYERRYLAVGARLSSAYQRGALEPDQWQQRNMELERLTLEDGDTAIGRKLDALEGLDSNISVQAEQVAQRRAEELRLRGSETVMEDGVRQRLDSALSAGDIATAEEVLLAVERHEKLPVDVRPEWMLEQWYPGVSNDIASTRDVNAITDRVMRGEAVHGVSSDLGEEHAKIVKAGFDAWGDLRSADHATVTSALTSVMLMLGLEITKCSRAKRDATKDFRQYDIIARPVGEPLVPHFGSKARGHYCHWYRRGTGSSHGSSGGPGENICTDSCVPGSSHAASAAGICRSRAHQVCIGSGDAHRPGDTGRSRSARTGALQWARAGGTSLHRSKSV